MMNPNARVNPGHRVKTRTSIFCRKKLDDERFKSSIACSQSESDSKGQTLNSPSSMTVIQLFLIGTVDKSNRGSHTSS